MRKRWKINQKKEGKNLPFSYLRKCVHRDQGNQDNYWKGKCRFVVKWSWIIKYFPARNKIRSLSNVYQRWLLLSQLIEYLVFRQYEEGLRYVCERYVARTMLQKKSMMMRQVSPQSWCLKLNFKIFCFCFFFSFCLRKWICGLVCTLIEKNRTRFKESA